MSKSLIEYLIFQYESNEYRNKTENQTMSRETMNNTTSHTVKKI